jgi:hypothetical protein
MDTALVAFVDVLGYSWLVKNFGQNIDVIKGIEAIFEGATGIGERLSQASAEKMLVDILSTVRIGFVSDSIVVVANLSQAEQIDPDNGRQNSMLTLGGYLSCISTSFIAKTGLLLRGGIAAGPHYENSTQISRFLFSWAYLRACELEKQAIMPRIVIDQKTAPQFEDLGMSWHDNNYQGKIFDFYHLFARPEFTSMAHIVLADIMNGVSRNLEYNRKNSKELSKITHFVNYHNRRIAQPDINLIRYTIEIPNSL